MVFNNLKDKAAHLLRGRNAEAQAEQFLIRQGLRPVTRNYRCKQGELDLVMTDGAVLVIVEVRFRKSDQYGSAVESITRRKQACIIAATQSYLAHHPGNPAVRFDVVAISGDGSLQWLRNAFQT